MLNNRFVRTIILSRILLQLGIWIRNFAILLYVSDVTHNDPLYVSLISVAEFAPIFMFSVIGGTFADRWQPKRTMVWCDVLSAISALVVLLVLLQGSWYALFFTTLASAILSQFSQPSAMKLFKQHIPEAQLQSVMAMFQSLMAVFMVIGPMIGTYVYQRFGIEVSVAVMGVMFVGSSLILLTLPRDEQQSMNAESQSFMEELKAGVRYVWNKRILRTLGASFAVSGLASGVIQPLMIYVTMDNLGHDKSFLQWLLMVHGAAMLVGGSLIMTFGKRLKPQTLLAVGLFFISFGTVGIGWSTSVVLTMLLLVLNGLCYPCIHIGIQTMIYQNTEGPFIGRVGGVLTPMFMGMMVIGMSFSGVWKSMFSTFIVYAGSGILFLIGSLLLVPVIIEKRSVKLTSSERI
ncbi:MFS transporter [Paenibacillus rigui]|uniref:MFS transporter n=1 Tax=Paenibacillus rigui TaxID=554312 RepID=UPI001FE64A34|nr:MFS transporter [Paenibacillus rigui]